MTISDDPEVHDTTPSLNGLQFHDPEWRSRSALPLLLLLVLLHGYLATRVPRAHVGLPGGSAKRPSPSAVSGGTG